MGTAPPEEACGMLLGRAHGPALEARAWPWRRLDVPLDGNTTSSYLWNVALLAALYYGTARLGVELQFTGPVAGIVWLPVGVAISYLSIRGLRYWPGALLGDVLSNDYGKLALGGAIGQTLGNLLEVLLAAYLIRRVMRHGSPLQSIRGVSGLLLAIAAGTLASATIGPLSLMASGTLAGHEYETVSRTWWLADASGALIVVPFALAWFTQVPRVRMRLVPALVTLLGVALCAWLSTRGDNALTYLVFPALVLAAIRFGSRVGTTAVVITAAFALWATTHYEGPFSYTSISHSVLVTQLFVVVSSISVLVVLALVLERVTAADDLSGARLDVIRAEYLERHRMERNLHDGVQQRMLALLIQLRSAEQLEEPAEMHIALERAEEEVRSVMEELRELAHGTFPPVLTEVGLAGAVAEIAAQSLVPVEILGVPAERSDVAVEAAAYYVVAEAVTNAQKHATATAVRVRVASTDDALDILVVDDGVGGAAEAAGTGLAGLRERVESFGGTFEVRSPAGAGTEIGAVIPRQPVNA